MRTTNAKAAFFALLALAAKSVGIARAPRGAHRPGVFGAALFYGDSILTPAVTVLGAIEGSAALPPLKPFVLPIAVVLVVALFAVPAARPQ